MENFKEKDYVTFEFEGKFIFGTIIEVGNNYLKISDGDKIYELDPRKAKIDKVEFDFISGDKKEMVNHPAHYHPGTYEAINVIEAWDLNFNLGSAIKYISRCGLKPDAELSKKEKTIEDLKKAAWYVNREIERLSK